MTDTISSTADIGSYLDSQLGKFVLTVGWSTEDLPRLHEWGGNEFH